MERLKEKKHLLQYFSKYFILLLPLFICTGTGIGQPVPLSDSDLDSVSAQNGVYMMVDNLQLDYSIDSLTIYDSDSVGTIEFREVLSVNNVFETDSKPMTLDVGQVAGQTYVRSEVLDWTQDYSIDIGSLYFCGYDLGGIRIGDIEKPSSYWYIGGHTSGLDFEYGLEAHIGTIDYHYAVANSLSFNGIHLVESVSGDPSDPDDSIDNSGDPWSYSGMFVIGDVSSGKPATADIGFSSAESAVVMRYQVPMNGALRIEDVSFGGSDFGPCAIDGITIHRMEVNFVP